ncbi:MAG: tyrosine-type recombinase/integrase [Rhodospirillaceae bacterium]
MRAKLNKTIIEDAVSRTQLKKGQKLAISDTEVKGLQAVVRSTGVVSFHVYYRTETREQRRPKIGEYPTLSVAAARQKAQQWLALVHMGQDPSAARDAKRKAPKVNDLIERFFSEHVDIHLKPSTAKDVKCMLNSYVLPVLGKDKVADIRRSDIEKIHASLRDRPTRANRVLAWTKVMFNKAIYWELRETSPCFGIRKYSERPRDRYLTDAELKAVGCALHQLELTQERIQGAIYTIRLVTLTGLRLGEVLNMKWADVNLTDALITLPDSKTGKRTVPIGTRTVEFLKKLSESANGELVVHGRDPKTVLDQSVVRRTWKRVCEIAMIMDARIHDLRHTFGTYAAQTGANAFLVSQSLGHKNLAMTDRYVSRATDPLVDVKNKVEDRVSSAMGMTSESAEILEFKKAN